MHPIIYNIPASLVQSYQDSPLIVRTSDPADSLRLFSRNTLEQLVCLHVPSLRFAGEELARLGGTIPLDLYMQEPEKEFPALYRCVRLLDTHPVRISMPVRPGVGKAVKVAVSLNFAVKLIVEQPDEPLIEELSQVLDLYLHLSTNTQPVEFYHSLLSAMYHRKTLTLWEIQEEDPVHSRYITENGKEYISARFAKRDLTTLENASFVARFGQKCLTAGGECSHCEFFDFCSGYFKWPNSEYSCKGILRILAQVRDAALQLTEALDGFGRQEGPNT